MIQDGFQVAAEHHFAIGDMSGNEFAANFIGGLSSKRRWSAVMRVSRRSPNANPRHGNTNI